MHTAYRISLLFIHLLFTSWLAAQDVEENLNRLRKVGEEKLQVTGGLRLNSNFYNASGIDARRDDFQWSARASLNLSFLGLNAPFSFVFSDANQRFGLPSYTFTGISPRYKWATLHAGDRSMSFSRYTMSGISFRGIGAEVAPGRFRAAAFYGALNRALANDLNAVGSLNGYYQRKGYGGKVGYGDDKTSIDVILFGAADDPNDNPRTENQGIATPLNNRIVSLAARRQLTRRFTLSGELAHSVTNNNRLATELDEAERDFGNELLGLITPTESVETGQAYQFGAYYTLDKMALRAGYERITRGYRTLGALFFNNDTENYTAGASRNFLENKLSLSVNGGLERTNLDERENETTSRVIASVNASYRPSNDWTIATGYSNFRNDTKLRGRTDPFNPVDSIFLAQVTQSIYGTVARQLGERASPRTLTLSVQHQRANSIVEDEVAVTNNTRFTNAALNYNGTVSQQLQYYAGVSANFTMIGDIGTNTVSPAAGLTANLLNNALSLQGRTALSLVGGGNRASKVLNLSGAAGYRLRSGHRINLSLVHLNRFGAEVAARNFREWYLQAGYAYQFGGALGLPGRTLPPSSAANPNKK